MSAPKVSHQVEPQGVRVTVRASTGSVCVSMTDSEAKRLAWGILNDLDPDAVYVNDRAYVGHRRASAIEWSAPVSPPKRIPFTESELLELIKRRQDGQSFDRIADMMGVTPAKVEYEVNRLRRAGRL